MTVTQGRDVAPVSVDQARAHLSPGETLLGVFALTPGDSAATVLAVTDRRVLSLREDELVLASTRPPVAPAGTGVGRVAFPDCGVAVRLLHPIELMTLGSMPHGAEAAPARSPSRVGVRPVSPQGSSERRLEQVGTSRSPHRRRDPTRIRLGLATWLYTAAGAGLYVWLSAQLGFWPLVVLAVAALILLVAWLLGRDAAVAVTQAVQVSPDQYPALHRHVAELAELAGIVPPTVYVSPLPLHNAFAARLPGESLVAVTEPLLATLTDRELRAVLATKSATCATGTPWSRTSSQRSLSRRPCSWLFSESCSPSCSPWLFAGSRRGRRRHGHRLHVPGWRVPGSGVPGPRLPAP